MQFLSKKCFVEITSFVGVHFGKIWRYKRKQILDKLTNFLAMFLAIYAFFSGIFFGKSSLWRLEELIEGLS